MSVLEELKKKYQELSEELERMKKSEMIYPIYCLSKSSGLIVKFDGLNTGIVVRQDYSYDVDKYRIDWQKHTDMDTWERLSVCPKTGFYNGQLIWCWDNDESHLRRVMFYNVRGECTFEHDGNRHGVTYDNYEPYEGNWPVWAQVAFEEF